MSISSRVRLTLVTATFLSWVAGVSGGEKKELPVSGLFKGNGQEVKLAHVSAHKGEPSRDRPTIRLIFTEKNHSSNKDARVKAFFGEYGSALIITVTHDGQVVGCEVVHAAHKKSGFTDIGRMKSTDVKIEGGKVKGKLTTDGELDTFGETWEVKLKFEVKAP